MQKSVYLRVRHASKPHMMLRGIVLRTFNPVYGIGVDVAVDFNADRSQFIKQN